MKEVIPTKLVRLQVSIYFIKAQMYASKTKDNFRKMLESDDGMDVIITLVLLALGLVVVGVLAKYAKQIVDAAGQQVNNVTSSGTTTAFGSGGFFGGGGGGSIF